MAELTDNWTLLCNMFKERDEVVLVLEDDTFAWGALHTLSDGVELCRQSRRTKFYPWEQIRFMAHDGFPVRKVTGPPSDHIIEDIDTTEVQQAVRGLLDAAKPKPKPRTGGWRRASGIGIGFGDPFVIEGVSATLCNPGRLFTPGEECEETIVMRSPEGAGGLLWDIPTIHAFACPTEQPA